MHFLEIEKYIIVDFFLFLVKSNSMIEKKGGYEQKTYSRLGANTLSAGSEQKKDVKSSLNCYFFEMREKYSQHSPKCLLNI